MYMYEYHADMIDETGCAFTRSVTRATKDEARAYFKENYPESRVRAVYTQREVEADARDRYWDAKERSW